ncbi:oligopeptide transport system permease protein [Verrucomicrobium sp. GAS474]|uniref:ABC transporter permease n=1 Tax=Verrucomicrobium sp. GAS474 TaxID=1882831 RepID=UPI00087BECAE|nr:ABC transporter permease [Verrucomicrobium sp. GAS474]SDU25522.1 oligopeptide transport system permease protein [Verrucomicrobium sp. GAS474]
MSDHLPVSAQPGVWKRFRRRPLAFYSLWFLLGLIVLVVAGPWLCGQSYAANNLALGATGPGRAHWFGTDELGRDLFVRILYGGRISFSVGLCATAVSLVIGVVYGAISGYCGGWIDSVLMRAVDILYALPFTVFVILLTVFFGHNFILLFVAIGAVEWLSMARIVRGQVQSLRQQDFVAAARILGSSERSIVFRHLIPNAIGPVIVYATLTVPAVMLTEAFLSFLGLGVQPPMSSWGSLIDDGAKVMEEFPWLIVFPSVALGATILSLNFVGDGLRDAFDPKKTGR